jgi:hypothetical protein
VLDGGFPHYDGGGLLEARTPAGRPDGRPARAELLETRVGSVFGRDVDWHDCTVRANGAPITGIALYCDHERLGVKLVGDGVDLAVGEAVTVAIETDG